MADVLSFPCAKVETIKRMERLIRSNKRYLKQIKEEQEEPEWVACIQNLVDTQVYMLEKFRADEYIEDCN